MLFLLDQTKQDVKYAIDALDEIETLQSNSNLSF